MILFDLKCAKDHVFEAWFKDSASYDDLVVARRLVCPVCGSKRVAKAPMAPRLAMGRAAEPAEAAPGRKMAVMGHTKALEEMRRHIEENCDYVGPQFAEEARKMHYGETDKRSIYGEATEEQTRALADEGIEVHSVPWPGRSDA